MRPRHLLQGAKALTKLMALLPTSDGDPVGMGSIGLASVDSDDDAQGGYVAIRGRPYSKATAALIDQDVQHLLDDAHKRARDMLSESLAQLDLLAEALLHSETITSEGLSQILGPQPAAPDLTPKQFSPDGKNLEVVSVA